MSDREPRSGSDQNLGTAGRVSFPGSAGRVGAESPRDGAFADRYRIIRKLGSGAMGPVYLAEHLEIGRLTAIKVLRDSIAENPESVKQFLEGASNAARVHHPHVCAVYDVGTTDDGLHYVAMEYVEGGSLADVLARMPRFRTERACRILLQVLEGLGAAHALGVVHRDLKPGNVILAVGDDGDDHVKIVDFDIAGRMVSPDGGDSVEARLLIGSPEYMSPEQIRGEPVDGRSDLYALGIILFRMLTGSFPFSGKGTQELMRKRLTQDPATLREVSPGRYPPGLQEVLDAALARDADSRFQAAQEMAWALSQVADPRVLQRESRRSAEPAEPLPRSAFQRPVIRVLAFWGVGVFLGMALGLIPTPFTTGRFAQRAAAEAEAAQQETSAGEVDGGPLVDPASAETADSPIGPLLDEPERGEAVPETSPLAPLRAEERPERPPARAVDPTPEPTPDPDPADPAAEDAGPLPQEGALRTELANLLAGIPSSQPDALRSTASRGEEIHADARLPADMRAEAAYVASSAHAMLRDMDAMIAWSRIALRLDPAHRGARELLDAVNP